MSTAVPLVTLKDGAQIPAVGLGQTQPTSTREGTEYSLQY